MMSKYILLLLIPVVYGQITVKITAGKTEGDTSVEYSGQDIAIISDKERESFNIEDRSLKEAAGKYSGREPTDVYVKRPTPWGDVYTKYNWQEVKRTLTPVRSRVIGIQTKPVIVSTRDFENHSNVTAKYNAAISQEVAETVSNSWSTSKTLTVGQEINYEVNFAAGSVGGTTSMSFAATWGSETSKTRAVTLASTTSMEVELKPGQAVLASLSATRGTLEIEVDYEASLSGEVFANYDGKYKGHLWWAYDIGAVLESADMPNRVTSTEKISIGFFTSATVVVSDKDFSNNIIMKIPVTIV